MAIVKESSQCMESPQNYCWWQLNNFTTVCSLLTAQGIRSFQQLKESRCIPDSEVFHYLQICHLLSAESLTRNHDWIASLVVFESRCNFNPMTNGFVSQLHSSILGNTVAWKPLYCSRWRGTLLFLSPWRNGPNLPIMYW